MRILSRGATAARVVALTFDCGSDTGNAAAILDRLAAEHVVATFGVTGAWARANPALVRRMAAEGHQVVNHSDTHLHMAALTSAERRAELARAEAAIRAAAGEGTDGWFRPPFGERNAAVDRDVAAAGFRYELMWTVDSLGWKGVPAAQVVERVVGGAVPGAIMLLHVGRASTDAEALPTMIDGLRARGYAFATAAALA